MESLYRKYRPQTFESMVGQKHIVSTLQNALTDGRMAHAYLFTGPRGTGKTTTARLLAKALMCEAGGGAATAHPDGTCEQCQEIARGTHPDVYELDAASRTGVDNVRDEIINRVAFAPTQGRYKVYVIDEVHMLTTAAFNALLKTLEEPPAHVVFVLCTTDPQKIPETVLSRCQRLEFHRISDADIAERLEFVCTSEGFEYDSEALALVARHARGGLRDALSTLETLSVHGRGTVRVEDARELLGEVADDTLSGMAELVAARDVAGCFARVDEMSSRGMDIEQYARDFTRHMRNVYVAAVAGKGALRDAAKPEEFVAQAAKFGGADRLAYILDLLGGLEDTLRTSTDQRLDFEVALTRMARPKADLSLEALAARVEALEAELAAVKAGGVALASAPAAAAGAQAAGVGQPGGGTAAQAAGSKLPSFARMQQQSAATQAAPAAPAPMVRPAAPVAPAPAARPAAPSAPAGQPAVQAAQVAQATAAPAPVAQRAVSQTPSAPAQAGASQLPSFARMPQQGAASSASATPQPAASQQSAAPAAAAPQAPDAHWGQICQEACAIFRPVIALLNKVTGHFDSDGSLVIVNPGGDFIGKQLQTPNSMNAIKQAAEKVMGHAVAIRVEGAGAALGRSVRPAAPAQAAPTARPSFGAQPGQSAAAPAAAAAAPARDAALPAFARMPQQSAPAAQPAAPAASAQNAALPAFARMPQTGQAAPAAASSSAVPAARDAALPAFARMPQAASAAPVPAAGNRPAAPAPQPVAPVDDVPAFEFVPDDMYDGYQDVSADVPADGYGAPWDEPAPAEVQPAAPVPAPRPAAPAPAPRPAAPQQPSGFGSAPAARPAAPAFAASVQPTVSAPTAQPAFAARPAAPAQPAAPAPAVQPAAPASGATFGSLAQPAPGEDSTAWLSQLLEAGFGQPVKVTRE